jgi:hypothetical protein
VSRSVWKCVCFHIDTDHRSCNIQIYLSLARSIWLWLI